MPLCRSHFRSDKVDFVPGRITKSALPSCPGFSAYRRLTPGIRENALKSVKLDRCGKRITTISSSPSAVRALSRPDRLSSSSRSSAAKGTTPNTGLPASSSSIARPGRRISKSPRNLLTISPLISACSSGSSSLTVP